MVQRAIGMDNTARTKIVSCPYCGAQKRVELPEGTVQAFPHPTDGKTRLELGYIDRELGVKILNDFWSPRVLPGTREQSVKCERCKSWFHTAFFAQKVDISKYFDLEFQGIASRPFADRLLDVFHLNYIISCILIAVLLWFAWAGPVILFGGLEKIMNDLSSLLFIPSLAIALFAIRFHMESIKRLKEPIKRLLRVKKPGMKIWIYERFKCYILGRGQPRKLLLPNLAGLLCLLIYLVYHLAYVVYLMPNLALFETPFVEVGQIEYTSYVSVIFGPILWGSLAFIFGTTLWLAISTTWAIYKIGAWLPLNINTLERTGGVEPLGRFALSGTVPLIAAEFVLVPSIFVTVRKVSIMRTFPQILGLIILTMTTIILFFSSLHSIHRGMRSKKEEALGRIRREYHIKEKQLLEIVSERFGSSVKERLDLLGDSLSNLEFFEKRIESMRTWPYDFGIIAKLIGSSILPFGMFLVRELISMV